MGKTRGGRKRTEGKGRAHKTIYEKRRGGKRREWERRGGMGRQEGIVTYESREEKRSEGNTREEKKR